MSSSLAVYVEWPLLMAFGQFKEHVSVHKVFSWVLAISSSEIFFLLGNKGWDGHLCTYTEIKWWYNHDMRCMNCCFLSLFPILKDLKTRFSVYDCQFSGYSFDRKYLQPSSQLSPLPIKWRDLWIILCCLLAEQSYFPLSENQEHLFLKAQSLSSYPQCNRAVTAHEIIQKEFPK